MTDQSARDLANQYLNSRTRPEGCPTFEKDNQGRIILHKNEIFCRYFNQELGFCPHSQMFQEKRRGVRMHLINSHKHPASAIAAGKPGRPPNDTEETLAFAKVMEACTSGSTTQNSQTLPPQPIGNQNIPSASISSNNQTSTPVEIQQDTFHQELFHHQLRREFQEFLKKHNANDSKFVDLVFAGSPSTCSGPSKNYTLVLSQNQAEQRLEMATEPELILFIDKLWFQTRPVFTLRTFVEHLESNSTQAFDVQELDHINSSLQTKSIKAGEIAKRLNYSGWDPDLRSYNMLSISVPSECIVPPSIAKHCALLSEACIAVSGRKKIGGKETHKRAKEVGLESCLYFGLCALAGAITRWHVDNNGVSTWVTIEESGYPDERKILKAWAVVSFNGIEADEKQEALAQFAKQGEGWQPKAEWIRVFMLQPGYTLFMPPGTIHAVINLTNCLARGGMRWDRRFFASHHLPAWALTAKHRDTVTNEDPTNQTIRILRYLDRELQNDFEDPESLQTFRSQIREVEVYSTPCNCKNCDKNCPCVKLGLRCFSGCATKNCANSWDKE